MKKTRNTQARTHITEILSVSEFALSQVEIFQRSEGVCDRVTTYRVLDRLLGEGLVHKTVGLDGVVRYAACKTCSDHKHELHHHVHFNCEVCGQVTCLDNVIPDFHLPRKYKVKDVNFTLQGTCPDCA
jgi:Fur family transcriptional regulator, ferric uptake regulator